MRVLSVAISLLALCQGGAASTSTSSHLSTVNRAGGWGAVDVSLEAGRFEPHHAHTWDPLAAAAAAPATPTTATKAGGAVTTPTPTPTVQHFTYDPFDLEAGPALWAKNFPTSQCAGTSQSPVQLPNYANAKAADNLLKPLAPSYDMPASTVLSLRNTGHALQINMPTGLTLSGGALGANPYSVVQMHMHARSEHSVGGAHYPLEFHIVHMDPARPAADPRALAVVGIMVAESPDNIANPALAPLASLLPSFTTPLNNFNASAQLNQPFSITNLLPTNLDYYHYNGSLTTPPCSEQVVWHVLTTPIWASRAQILALTAPFGTVGNSRPTQSLNGRSVAVTSFYTPTQPPPQTSVPTTSAAFGAPGASQGNTNTPAGAGTGATTTTTTNTMNVPLIVGATVGGAVVLLVIVAFVMYRRGQSSASRVVSRV